MSKEDVKGLFELLGYFLLGLSAIALLPIAIPLGIIFFIFCVIAGVGMWVVDKYNEHCT